ncbi:Protein of unknown function [Gryllus bimaculatus]|nr:Protein of unknown function [Gryllus bimaculatus]
MEPCTTLVLLLVCFIVPQDGAAFKGLFKWLFRSSGKAIRNSPSLPVIVPVRTQYLKIPRSDFGDFPSPRLTTQGDNIDDLLIKDPIKDSASFFLERLADAGQSEERNYEWNHPPPTTFLDFVLRNLRERNSLEDDRADSNGSVIYGDTEKGKWNESRNDGKMSDANTNNNKTCDFPVSNVRCFIPTFHTYYDPILKICKVEFGTSRGCQEGNR